MKPIPLFGTGVQSISAHVTAQRRLNCVYEIREDGDKSKFVIRGTPGLSSAFVLPTSPIRGWNEAKKVLYVVGGNALYTIDIAGIVTKRGTLNTSVGYVDIQDNGVEVMLVDGQDGWVYNIGSTSFDQITDANFPAGATSLSYAQGRFLANLPNTAQWYASGSFAGLQWGANAALSPLIFNTKEDHSDNLLAISALHDVIILWGDETTEFWQNVGAYPNPYSRIPGTTQDWGLAAVLSRAPFGNTIAFLAKNSQGKVQVMSLNGYVPQRISNHDIENMIESFPISSDAVALSYIFNGHVLYQITFPSVNRSLLYDGTTNLWSEVQTGVDEYGRHIANLGVVFNKNNYVSDSTTSTIYLVDPVALTDNGMPIKREVRSRHIYNSGNDVQLGQLQLDMDVGGAPQIGQGSDPRIMLQVSRNGGKTFEGERWQPMGKAGEYFTRIIWRRIGSAKDFVFKWVVTDPVPFIVVQGWAMPAETEEV
jgi:hypothetical protein